MHKYDSNIPHKKGIDITYQGRRFRISIAYRSDDIDFIKSLDRCYWHTEHKIWICDGTIANANRLQKRFEYWSSIAYVRLLEHCTQNTKPRSIHIRPVSKRKELIEISVKHCEEAISFIKTLSERFYNKSRKSWFVKREKTTRDSLQYIAEKHQVRFIDKIEWYVQVPITQTTNGSAKRIAIERTIPDKFQPFVFPLIRSMVREGYSYNTIKSYSKSLMVYIDYFNFEKSIIHNIQIETIEEYLNSVVERNISQSLLNMHISAIKFYYEHVHHWSSFRLMLIRRPKKKRRLPTVMSEGEVQRLFDTVKNLKHRCMLFMAYGIGLRAGEVVGMQVADINFERNTVFIRQAKGGKDRIVPLPSMLKSALENYIEQYTPDHWLFGGQGRGKPYSHSSLRAVFNRALRGANLPSELKLHSLRHSFATHLLENGTSLRVIQHLLGHNSSKTTEIYTHISKTSLDKIVSPLDKIYRQKSATNTSKPSDINKFYTIKASKKMKDLLDFEKSNET